MKQQVTSLISLSGADSIAARKIPTTPSTIKKQQVSTLFVVNIFAARANAIMQLILVDGRVRYAGTGKGFFALTAGGALPAVVFSAAIA